MRPKALGWLCGCLVFTALVAASIRGTAVQADCGAINRAAMPNLGALHIRTEPLLHTNSRTIKGLYYANRPDGPNDLVVWRRQKIPFGCGSQDGLCGFASGVVGTICSSRTTSCRTWGAQSRHRNKNR
jgi:hypothetical protein